MDVRNAFNSVKWDNMINALEKFETPEYILRIMKSYLKDRVLIYDTADGPQKRNR